jgi:hypothetical protein
MFHNSAVLGMKYIFIYCHYIYTTNKLQTARLHHRRIEIAELHFVSKYTEYAVADIRQGVVLQLGPLK